MEAAEVIAGGGAGDFALYRYPTTADLPGGDGNGLTYARFRTLTSLFAGADRYSADQIAERHAAVRFTNPDRPVRTLWYALYDTERRTMSVSFYLRDSDHGEIRTPQLAFSLQPARARPLGALAAPGARSGPLPRWRCDGRWQRHQAGRRPPFEGHHDAERSMNTCWAPRRASPAAGCRRTYPPSGCMSHAEQLSSS